MVFARIARSQQLRVPTARNTLKESVVTLQGIPKDARIITCASGADLL